MARLLYVLILALTSSQINAQGLPSDTLKFYDFWVGTWDAEWDEGDGKKGKGINRIEKILDGKVLEENFEIHEGQSAGFKGTSISVFQPQLKKWKQAWADNQGGYYDFEGAVDGSKRMFQTQVRELADGRKFIQRMVFYDIKEDSFTWDWESSVNGGEDWTLNWRIYYTRKQ